MILHISDITWDLSFSVWTSLSMVISSIIWKESESESCLVVSDSLWPHGLYRPWNSPGQNTRVGSFSLLQRIFPTQGSNSGLPHCKWILYHLNHQGSPRILEWNAVPSSRGSSQLRDQTQVSHIADRFFTIWPTREAHIYETEALCYTPETSTPL